jgi:hypothetical protein
MRSARMELRYLRRCLAQPEFHGQEKFSSDAQLSKFI